MSRNFNKNYLQDHLKNPNLTWICWKSTIDSAVSYFLENRDPIKKQWVTCSKDTAFNLGGANNNRLESVNSKIKSVCLRYGSLLQFLPNFPPPVNTEMNDNTTG